MLSRMFLAAMLGFTSQTVGLASETANQTPSSVSPDSTTTPAPAATIKRPPISREMRGDIFMARKMFDSAIEQYKAAPASAVVTNKIGIAYHQLQELPLAKKYYQRAVKLDPRYSDAINNLGTIYYADKSYRRAVGQYKRALRLAPRSATIYSNLGSAYFSRRDYKRAFDCHNTALSLDPAVFDNHSTTGVLLQDSSVEDRATYHYYMARLYARSGSVDRALQYIRKSLEEGFRDRKKFREEPDFAGLQKLPEFQELMRSDPRVL